MLAKRIIPCMDIREGRVVKGIGFSSLADAGDPVELGRRYYLEGADELVFLDIDASSEGRKTMKALVREVAGNVFIPFTVGGGIKSVDDIRELLTAGADKVSICTAAVLTPEIISEGARRFGSQCIVVSIDVKRNPEKENWEVYIYGGRQNTGLDALAFAKACEALGAGEILLNSLDRDGTKEGYDLEILRIISESVKIPVIASSGAGNPGQVYEAFSLGKADAALCASIFHYNKYSIREVKGYLRKKGLCIR